jgi:solute carrier family 35 protein F1/2
MVGISRRLILILFVGQGISLILALTGFLSTNLTEHNFVYPVLQSTGFYFLLSLFLLTQPWPIKMPIPLYALLAFLDMEANFLAVLAYQFTDITSILLLNSLTIPWVVVLSYVFLKRRYNLKQIGAVVGCLIGLGLVIASDMLRDRWDSAGPGEAWIGDLICVGSSFLYACQNVLQEYLLKKLGSDRIASVGEYLGMLGLFGFILSTIQWTILERKDLWKARESLWTTEVIGMFVGFSFTMLALYLSLTWFIGKFDASVFNMNILTASIYGVLLDFAQKKASPRIATDWLYLLAYGFIVTGVVYYSVNERVHAIEEKSSSDRLDTDANDHHIQ